MKRFSSTFLWLAVFAALVAVEVFSAFGQASEVTGYWKNGSIGAISYKDRVTGTTKPGRGSLFSYEFLPNGNYEFIGYMETTVYSCSTTLFNQITGKYRVEGSTIYLDPIRDFWKNTNSCAASGNRQQTRTPVKKALDFEITTDEYGAELLCVNDAGSASCFRKEKDRTK
jgi:hypothetical protein